MGDITVIRYIYILDVGYGPSGNEVAPYVYKKVDVISGSDDSVSAALFKTVALPLTAKLSLASAKPIMLAPKEVHPLLRCRTLHKDALRIMQTNVKC
jgi:hypothetical protein